MIVFVDVSTNPAAFVGTIVHQVSLRRTVNNHRCVEVGKTPLVIAIPGLNSQSRNPGLRNL